MQFNLVNNQEQVAEFVWGGVALHCMALALGFISILAGCLQRFFPCGFCLAQRSVWWRSHAF